MIRPDHTPTNPDDTPAQILSPITKALKNNNITLEQTCQRLKESMDAYETKVFQGKDGLVYSKDLISHGIRLKASVEALKLQQAYPVEQLNVVVYPTMQSVVRVLAGDGKRLPEMAEDGKTETEEG